MLPTVLRRKRDLSNIFDDFDSFFSPVLRESGGPSLHFPRVDVHEDENNYYIEADLPGIEKDKIAINIESNVLTLSGSRDDKREDKKGGYYRFERQTGNFERSFELGQNIDSSKADAEFDKGVLKITIPKKEESKPKQLDIKIK